MIMDFTIYCTRVPIPQGTTLYGIPVDIGPAPAQQDPASAQGVPLGTSNDGTALNPLGQAIPDGNEADLTPPKNLKEISHQLS